MYYHENKKAAIAAGAADFPHEDWIVDAQFEPDNGFVLVVSPRTFETLKGVNITWVLDRAELRVNFKRRPANHNRVKLQRPSTSGGGGGGTPRSGATGRVHAIADAMHKEQPLLRADRHRVIQACVDQGINKATAATQWSKWAKNNGL